MRFLLQKICVVKCTVSYFQFLVYFNYPPPPNSYLSPEPLPPFRSHADIHIAPQTPFLHITIPSPHKPHQALDFCRVFCRLQPRAHVRFRHDLQQGHACSVQVHLAGENNRERGSAVSRGVFFRSVLPGSCGGKGGSVAVIGSVIFGVGGMEYAL